MCAGLKSNGSVIIRVSSYKGGNTQAKDATGVAQDMCDGMSLSCWFEKIIPYLSIHILLFSDTAR